jgi:hypothetical protein
MGQGTPFGDCDRVRYDYPREHRRSKQYVHKRYISGHPRQLQIKKTNELCGTSVRVQANAYETAYYVSFLSVSAERHCCTPLVARILWDDTSWNLQDNIPMHKKLPHIIKDIQREMHVRGLKPIHPQRLGYSVPRTDSSAKALHVLPRTQLIDSPVSAYIPSLLI